MAVDFRQAPFLFGQGFQGGSGFGGTHCHAFRKAVGKDFPRLSALLDHPARGAAHVIDPRVAVEREAILHAMIPHKYFRGRIENHGAQAG